MVHFMRVSLCAALLSGVLACEEAGVPIQLGSTPSASMEPTAPPPTATPPSTATPGHVSSTPSGTFTPTQPPTPTATPTPTPLCQDTDQDGICDDLDCAPSDPAVYPGAEEECNGIDDDCDELTDEAVKPVFYVDGDRDGYGDPQQPVIQCTIQEGLVNQAGDCDDTRAVLQLSVVGRPAGRALAPHVVASGGGLGVTTHGVPSRRRRIAS